MVNRYPGTRIVYDWTHQKRRRAWAHRVNGGLVHCRRCLQPIIPGQPWDLDHVDGSSYPSHASCNRAAG